MKSNRLRKIYSNLIEINVTNVKHVEIHRNWSYYQSIIFLHVPLSFSPEFYPHFRQRNNLSHHEGVIATQQTEVLNIEKDRRNSCSARKKLPNPGPIYLVSRYISEFLISQNFTPA